MPSDIPDQPPPSYDEVTGSSSSHPTASSSNNGHLAVPGGASSSHPIPLKTRRSMEDELRPLPKGWVRTFDPDSQHQFFVDTTADPPRSIWTHPYDDEQYLRTLSTEERERAEQESLGRGHPQSKADIMAEHTDEEDEHDHHIPGSSSHDAELPPRPDASDKGKKATFGRRMKDKMTGTTHEEREVERKKRAEAEKKLYEQHVRIRNAMAKAEQTGKPQLIGKDSKGKDIYIEPSQYQGGSSMYGGGGYGYNPYGSSGIYSTPNARYVRPQSAYSRPYGRGYGGGYGMPLGLGIGGGLMGGLLLGDMMGGGMGMGGMGMGMGGMGMGGGFGGGGL